jgi:pimeloyl-ACP methyl ester carboxylesterase
MSWIRGGILAVFVLIHGAGSTAWDWHLVRPLLEASGHDVIAVDLPIEDENAGLEDYVRVVTAAVGDAQRTIVVGHSLGGFTAPLVCDQLQADGLMYLAGMIPLPGEAFADWWTNTGHDRETIDPDPNAAFFNDVPEDLVHQARERERDQQGAWMAQPWPGHLLRQYFRKGADLGTVEPADVLLPRMRSTGGRARSWLGPAQLPSLRRIKRQRLKGPIGAALS